MLERTIVGPEYTVGILGEEALPVVELRPRNAFYDYHAKYTSGMTEYVVPAPLAKKIEKKLKKIALQTHKLLGLRDMSRIDFKYDHKREKAFVLEANSIPGFTEFSLLPKAARAKGLNFSELCTKLVRFAWMRSAGQRHGA
jgi:D-alanine-D-alanine ligase